MRRTMRRRAPRLTAESELRRYAVGSILCLRAERLTLLQCAWSTALRLAHLDGRSIPAASRLVTPSPYVMIRETV